MTLIDDEDYEIVQRAYDIDRLSNKVTDVLMLYSNLGYKITPKLIAEIKEVDDMDLFEETTASINLYVIPEESKKKNFSTILKKKVSSLGDPYTLMALSFNVQAQRGAPIKRDNLVLKRVSLPKYIAKICRATGLLGCASEEEIREFKFQQV